MINLYNIDRDRLIVGAPVKNQCSGDYFYGDDPDLDRALQVSERSYSTTLRSIQLPNYQLNDDDRSVLRWFWLLQFMRTEAASRRFASISNDIAKNFGMEGNEFRIQLREAVILAMQTFTRTMHVVDDLKICLIRNRSSIPFVTSDDPAILTNRWHLYDPRVSWKSFGLSAAGCLFLLPLTPTILCVGYDGNVYSIPHSGGWTETRRVADILAFNQHQFLNCRANIFLGRDDGIASVRQQWAKAVPLRPVTRHQIIFAVKEKSAADGYERYKVINRAEAPEEGEALVQMKPVHAQPSAWPLLLQWKSKGIVYTNGSAAVTFENLKYDQTSEGHSEKKKRGLVFNPGWSTRVMH